MLSILLLSSPVLAVLAVPVAYLLSRVTEPPTGPGAAAKCRACGYSTDGLPGGARCPECGQIGAERAVQARARQGEWCGQCGYSLKGLAEDASCPECGETAVERAARLKRNVRIPWPKGEGVLMCCAAAHVPWVLAVMFGSASTGISVEGIVIGVMLAAFVMALPLGLAVWSCLVVARRGDAVLSAGSLALLAVLPLIANLWFVANLGSLKTHGGWFDGLANALMMWMYGPLMMMGALGLFSVCGVVTAVVMGVRRVVSGVE